MPVPFSRRWGNDRHRQRASISNSQRAYLNSIAKKIGIPFEVRAKSKADAIKRARVLADRDGLTGWAKSTGRLTFTATEARFGMIEQ